MNNQPKLKGERFTISIPKPIMKLKGFISLLLLISFVIVGISGIVLQRFTVSNVKPAPVWIKMHNLSGYIMIGLVILHFILNHKLFIEELKQLFGKSSK
ncbi:MAG: DUF4405 domain-containing protein [Thermosipho sp. (in: Bacteria)]|nr:DUF4405 domain-containing protein [Thermosipho sp. (in: thermotogales)]